MTLIIPSLLLINLIGIVPVHAEAFFSLESKQAQAFSIDPTYFNDSVKFTLVDQANQLFVGKFFSFFEASDELKQLQVPAEISEASFIDNVNSIEFGEENYLVFLSALHEGIANPVGHILRYQNSQLVHH